MKGTYGRNTEASDIKTKAPVINAVSSPSRFAFQIPAFTQTAGCQVSTWSRQ
jgi:hypothetical protein